MLSVVAYATTFGRHIYAVGGNERAARLAGVPVTPVRLGRLLASPGMLAGVAGIIFTGQAQVGVPEGAGPSLLELDRRHRRRWHRPVRVASAARSGPCSARW